MTKKIILSLAGALALSLATAAVSTGCDDNKATSNDMGGTGGGGGDDMAGGGGNADMAFVCVQSPMSDPDFLNGCAPAGVDSVLIDPFYPALAPNGQLPPIQ